MSIKQHWNWQNLETETFWDEAVERRRERAIGSGLKHGRGWFRWGGNAEDENYVPASVLGIEWTLGKSVHLLGIGITVEHDEEHLKASVHAVKAALYVTVESPVSRRIARKLVPKWGASRMIQFTLDRGEWPLRWKLWTDWRGYERLPKWREGSWGPARALLGKRMVEWEHIATMPVEIPMPERTYPATVELRNHVSWRSRTPFRKRRLRCANVEIPGGIGTPGKGENAWDCGDDAIFSMSCPAQTVEEAIGKVVESVLRDRLKYSGSLTFKPAKDAA